MSDQDTKTRFETTSKDCYDAYVAWCANQKDTEKRATLNETIHELRKVVSRFEIELAISERNDNRKKPLANSKRRQNDDGENAGEPKKVNIQKRSGPRRRKAVSGGGSEEE